MAAGSPTQNLLRVCRISLLLCNHAPCARIDAGTGLLPGLVGEIDALYVTPQARGGGTSSALAKAAIAELREHGADVIHNLACIEDDETQAFWQAQGFERDTVCLSLYGRS